MSRPVVTALMLADLKRSGAEIRLAKDALITPAARDWLKENRLPITWEDSPRGSASLAVVLNPMLPEMRAVRSMLDRMGGLAEVIEPAPGRGGLAAATRRLCGKVARREVAKGVILAEDACIPCCIANKHVGIRAVHGVNVPAVEEACRQIGANVLVLEYPVQTSFQIRQMIDRFRKGATAPHPELVGMIESIEQGGGRADW